jgi:hypothetical protein
MSERGDDERDGGSLMAGLTTVARSRQGRSLLRRAAPWIAAVLASALTGTGGWVASKMDSKAEMAEAVAVRGELLAIKALVRDLDEKLFATEPGKRGSVTKLERGQYFAWRALSELRAAAYVDQSERRRRRMDDVGAKFASKYDKRAQDDPPEVAYDELFAQVHVE